MDVNLITTLLRVTNQPQTCFEILSALVSFNQRSGLLVDEMFGAVDVG